MLFRSVKKFIFVGSASQYKIAHSENCNYLINIYGTAKFACQEMIKTIAVKNELDFNIILFNNIFGVGDMSNRSTNSLMRQFRKDIRPKLITGNHLHDWTYISDAVDGLMAVVTEGKNQKTYYIGARTPRLFRDIVTEVANIVAPNMQLIFGEYHDESYIDYSKIDLDELYNDTGFVCNADFKESILKTATWLQMIDD